MNTLEVQAKDVNKKFRKGENRNAGQHWNIFNHMTN